mgnify:CR=1 FL=1
MSDLASKEYAVWLSALKDKIHSAQIKAAVKVNEELLSLYWELGKELTQKLEKASWGENLIGQLAKDLSVSFPEMKGFSRANLYSIRKWYLSYRDADKKVQQLVRQIPWGHNTLLINKLKSMEERLWYAQNTLKNDWSRAVLMHQMESELYRRQGSALTNFKTALPSPQSELAHETLKDPYVFDFLTLGAKVLERDIEDNLISHISKFLLELGSGFAFVGRQYCLKVNDKDFHIDLLFFHTQLNCYVVIELKATEFDPRDAGQLNFYMAAIDGEVKQVFHNPTIGLLLCKEKDHLVVEYALKNIDAPIGVSQYQLTKSIPTDMKGKLPSIEELERSVSSSTAFNNSEPDHSKDS